MFGNQNDESTVAPTTIHGDQPANNQGSAPDLPTMGGQNSPFGAPPAQPSDEASGQDNGDQNEPQYTAPSTDDQQLPSAPAGGELVDIKQQALSQLSPLVSHLDQTPEEKFRTTMMMIQATDDQSLLKEAYDSAQKIEDDKVRAQALLDVINEINYFTQQQK